MPVTFVDPTDEERDIFERIPTEETWSTYREDIEHTLLPDGNYQWIFSHEHKNKKSTQDLISFYYYRLDNLVLWKEIQADFGPFQEKYTLYRGMCFLSLEKLIQWANNSFFDRTTRWEWVLERGKTTACALYGNSTDVQVYTAPFDEILEDPEDPEDPDYAYGLVQRVTVDGSRVVSDFRSLCSGPYEGTPKWKNIHFCKVGSILDVVLEPGEYSVETILMYKGKINKFWLKQFVDEYETYKHFGYGTFYHEETLYEKI